MMDLIVLSISDRHVLQWPALAMPSMMRVGTVKGGRECWHRSVHAMAEYGHFGLTWQSSETMFSFTTLLHDQNNRHKNVDGPHQCQGTRSAQMVCFLQASVVTIVGIGAYPLLLFGELAFLLFLLWLASVTLWDCFWLPATSDISNWSFPLFSSAPLLGGGEPRDLEEFVGLRPSHSVTWVKLAEVNFTSRFSEAGHSFRISDTTWKTIVQDCYFPIETYILYVMCHKPYTIWYACQCRMHGTRSPVLQYRLHQYLNWTCQFQRPWNFRK